MGRFSYTPSQIARMPEREVRKIYSEYRKIANKRAARLRARGFSDWELSKKKFAKTKDLDAQEVREQFAEVNLFLRDTRTKLKTLQKWVDSEIESLHEHGYDFVNHSNFRKFIDFMEWAKSRAGANDRVNGSNRVAELFEQTERLKISANALQKNFDFYLENLDKISKVKPLENTNRAMSDRELTSRINKVGKKEEQRNINKLSRSRRIRRLKRK